MIKQKEGFSLEISKATAEAIGISEQTDVELIVIDGMLILKPKGKGDSIVKKREAKLIDLTNQLMDKYGPVLKKLAKT